MANTARGGAGGGARSDGAGVAFYYFNYSPDRMIHPLRGIDVSHHQGVVDWGKVAKSDVAFAILKATEGAT